VRVATGKSNARASGIQRHLNLRTLYFMNILSVDVASVRISELAGRQPFGNPNADATRGEFVEVIR
jgi:hypothetical protein